MFLGVLYFGGRLLTRGNIIKVSGRKMEVIEKISLSADRYLLMFKVKDTIYIMMVHKNGSELIDSIPADSFDDENISSIQENVQFSEIMSKLGNFKKIK